MRTIEGRWEIHGQLDAGVWHPLFIYRDEMIARAVLKHIIQLEAPGQGIDEYDDFRLVSEEEAERLRAAVNGVSRPARKAQERRSLPARSRDRAEAGSARKRQNKAVPKTKKARRA